MKPVWEFFRDNWTSGVEIAILATGVYYAYLNFRGTRGAKVLIGLLLLYLSLTLLSQLLDLKVINWLLSSFSVFLAVALVVIFQPELRRVLAEVGSHHFFTGTRHKRESIEELTTAVFRLANKNVGALIAIERDTSIQSFAESGVTLDSEFSPELIETIFHPKTPLHDGGLIMQGERVLAAACIFPLSQREMLDRQLGLRHRAALGICEESDAVALVVSEETGTVSICHHGQIERGFDATSFKARLSELMFVEERYEKPADEQLES
ncbi:unnamed protein product [uncultured bacterium]|nr:unnamed protein product [uncultured bacterium]